MATVQSSDISTPPDKSAVSGAEVTARNPATGFSRTVKADADGSYRFPFLPVGTYTIEASKDGKSLGSLADVTVNLGVATTADLDLGGAVARSRHRGGLASRERRGRHVHRERDQHHALKNWSDCPWSVT